MSSTDRSSLLNSDKSLEEGNGRKRCSKIIVVTLIVLCLAAVVVVVIYFVPFGDGKGTGTGSGSDALGCNVNNGGCQGTCSEVDNSTVCSCSAGFLLGQDKKSCTDIDECAVNQGGCNHICSNTEGSYDCLCYPGFALSGDDKTCAAELFYSDRTSGVHCIFPETGDNELLIESDGAYAIDFDCRNGMIYWSSVADDEINRGYLIDGKIEDSETLVDADVGLEYPTDITIDTVNNNLYWSDFNAEHIGMLSMDDNTFHVNLISDMKKRDPLAVAVNPDAGHFYWGYAVNVDLTKRDFGVVQYSLDGSTPTPLVDGLPGVSGLKYDSMTNSVCWCDKVTTIECINLDDSSRHVITDDGKQPFDVAFTDDTVYWISIELNDILYLPRNDTNAEIQYMNITAAEPRGITVGSYCQ
ncbi:low-density lipoprotein receptor-related protein 5-like [Glandiceps talaboti]